MHRRDEPNQSSAARRMLFVSSVVDGGSGRSQRELAARLGQLDCEVLLLADSGTHNRVWRWLLDELADVAVRFSGGRVEKVSWAVRQRIGRRGRKRSIDGTNYVDSVAPENLLESVIDEFDPAVVVASSIDRVAWRKVRSSCSRRGVKSVLYLREEPALAHLRAGLLPDVLLANSKSLVEESAAAGHRCEFVPSIVEVSPSSGVSNPSVVLLVNPIRSHGVEVAEAIAAARPDIPVVLQESWPLDAAQRSAVQHIETELANIEYRGFVDDPGSIYADARLLLAPHRVDNRPRVVLEAQSRGIPVVASDHSGLAEAVGPGGILVDRRADSEFWVDAVTDLWDDPDQLENLGVLAAAHAARPEVEPGQVACQFLDLVGQQVGAGVAQ